ncbi:MAG: 2,3,4,5-tetrahydropyridine-2,6-dicarboxylate N-succinyltransferase, partial [Parvularculaceae bacterium]
MTPDLSLLARTIDDAWDARSELNAQTKGAVRGAIDEALALLDAGKARIAEPAPGRANLTEWRVNQWLKKAVLLSFR